MVEITHYSCEAEGAYESVKHGDATSEGSCRNLRNQSRKMGSR